jgi:hypothetical protein
VKQRITQKQYEELSPEQRMAYIAWTLKKQNETSDYTEVYRSIGHLIWFLDDHRATTNVTWEGGFIARNYSRYRGEERDEWDVSGDGPLYGKYYDAKELVDALWEAVKSVLKREETANAS